MRLLVSVESYVNVKYSARINYNAHRADHHPRRELQKEVEGWVGGWEEAARKEVGRRGEEDVREEWGRGWFGAWRLPV